MYVDSHLDHHKRTAFGTVADPESAPIARWSRLRIACFVLTVSTLPVVMPIRWALIGPLSYLFPPLRRLTVRRMSTLVINGRYRRPEPRPGQRARWKVQEAGALFQESQAPRRNLVRLDEGLDRSLFYCILDDFN
jgi:hypothetical protein